MMCRAIVMLGMVFVLALSSTGKAYVTLYVQLDDADFYAGQDASRNDVYRVKIDNSEAEDITALSLNFAPLPTKLGVGMAFNNRDELAVFGFAPDSFFVLPKTVEPSVVRAGATGVVDGANVGLAASYSVPAGLSLVPAGGGPTTVAILVLPAGSPDPIAALGSSLGGFAVIGDREIPVGPVDPAELLYVFKAGADGVSTGFDPSGGASKIGRLIADEDLIDIQLAHDSFANVDVYLQTDLQEDQSSGGVASGIFTGGHLRMHGRDGDRILSVDAPILSMTLEEVRVDGKSLLRGTGQLDMSNLDSMVVTGGIADFSITLDPALADLVDFGSPFSGDMAIDVPEPASLALLTLGGPAVIRRRVKAERS